MTIPQTKDAKAIEQIVDRYRTMAEGRWAAAYIAGGATPPNTAAQAQATIAAMGFAGNQVRENGDPELVEGDRSYGKPFGAFDAAPLIWCAAVDQTNWAVPTDNSTGNDADWAGWTQQGPTIVDLSNPLWTIPPGGEVIVTIPMIPMAGTERGLGFSVAFTAAFTDPSCVVQIDMESNAGHFLSAGCDFLGGTITAEYNGAAFIDAQAGAAAAGLIQMTAYGNVEGPVGLGVRSSEGFGSSNVSKRVDIPTFGGGGPNGDCRITVINGGAAPMTVDWGGVLMGNFFTGPTGMFGP